MAMEICGSTSFTGYSVFLMSRISAFEAMASDIGVRRYSGEGDLSYCIRSSYSASRYWTSAFCMDDGQGGAKGVTKQALSKRLNRWVTSLDQIMPGVGGWFEANGKKDMRAVYGRLIDVGDVLPAGEGGRCVARSVTFRPITGRAALALGFFEPATANFGGSMVTSGLGSLVLGKYEAPAPRAPWWETDFPYMAWSSSSDYVDLQYIDSSVHRWGLANSNSWTKAGLDDRPFSLARYVDPISGEPHYLVVRESGKRELASRIDRHMAQELLIHLKKESGNPIIIEFKRLDDNHFSALLPISILSQQISAIIDALSWPMEGVSSNGGRILRAEAVDAVKELLVISGIEVK